MKFTKKQFKPNKEQNNSILTKEGFIRINNELSLDFLKEKLTENESLINKTDINGNSFLSYALKEKKLDLAKFLLSSPLIDMSFEDYEGNSYLHLAVKFFHTSLIVPIIEKGAEINATNLDGNTALHFAYMLNNSDIISLLIEKGADIFIQNFDGLKFNEMPQVENGKKPNMSFTEKFNKSHKLDLNDNNESMENRSNVLYLENNNSNIYVKTLVDPKNKKNKFFFDFDRYDNNNNFIYENSIYDKEVNIGEFFKFEDKHIDNKNLIMGNKEDENKISSNINKSGLKESFECEHSIIENESQLKNNKSSFEIEFQNEQELITENKEELVNIKKTKQKDNNINQINKINKNLDLCELNSSNAIISNYPSAIPATTEQNKNSNRIDIEYYSNKSLFEFLSEIKLEKYYDILNSNGFDDISLIIEQTKTGIALTDDNLKEIGMLPGERAKLLIKVQEEANNFSFPLPKGVYYTAINLSSIESDKFIKKLNFWLSNLKVEQYLSNFIKNGYQSLELLKIQMESKQPLTSEILKNEIGIDKLGYRARIINRLKEEGRRLINELKTTKMLISNTSENKSCNCLIC